MFDAWKFLTLAESEAAETVSLPVGPLLVPVAVWRSRRRELVEREYAHGWPLGVWLTAGEMPSAIADDIEDFSVIAVHFPNATDGRGHFTARMLRWRYRYRGELRAFGEVPDEQVSFLRRSGFDEFASRDYLAAHGPLAIPVEAEQAPKPASGQPLRLVCLRPAPAVPRADSVRAA
jgi:uncharacterized protein (DUF934 family)